MQELTKYGFAAKELSKADALDILDVIIPTIPTSGRHRSMIKKDIRVAMGHIEYTFEHEHYTAIGVLKDNKLIGIALCNNKKKEPWIGKLTILKEYRKTKAFILLTHYIANILYPNEMIRLNTPSVKDFGSVIVQLPGAIGGGQAILPNTGSRLKKIIDRG